MANDICPWCGKDTTRAIAPSRRREASIRPATQAASRTQPSKQPKAPAKAAPKPAKAAPKPAKAKPVVATTNAAAAKAGRRP